MFNLLAKTSLLNLGRWVISHLLVAIVALSLVTSLNVTAQTGSPNPADQNVEVFFDQPYKDFAKCVKYLYFNGSRIRGYDGDTFSAVYLNEYRKYKPEVFVQKCRERGYSIDVRINNENIDNFKKVAHCLDEIEFFNNPAYPERYGWYQSNNDRIVSCIDVTRNTLGSLRQQYLDCIIKEKYNHTTGYLDKNNSQLSDLCLSGLEKFNIFPRNISDYFQNYENLLSCLSHEIRKPKFDTNNNTWIWKDNANSSDTNYCRYIIRDVFGLQMKTPYELGIASNNGQVINVPDLNFNPIIIEIPTEQTCWISKTGKNDGPNLQNIWNPGNWLPLMYNCANTTSDGRPIPLHPINLIPITIRLFAFVTSLLIWLIVFNIVIGIILFTIGIATSLLKWVKNILLGSVAVVIMLIFMYFILYFILSILQP